MDSFYQLLPEQILSSVESIGQRSTGRCLALNSCENRVYEVEMESGEKLIAKFYRPGRWSEEAILEEHKFLHQLTEVEVPVVAPIKLPNGKTLIKNEIGIWFSIFPKARGRIEDELGDDRLRQLGRFIGRIHNIGSQEKFVHRPTLDLNTYGNQNIEFLRKNNWVPEDLRERYFSVTQQILKILENSFKSVNPIRLHGDCHLGNILWNETGPFILDFDDVVMGPPVQDIWLIVPGRDQTAIDKRKTLLEGYTQMRQFDESTLNLIEPLRVLRMIHFSAWIARRWVDPSFTRLFPSFNTHKYWTEEILALQEQLGYLLN